MTMITAHMMSGSRQELMDFLNICSEILFNLCLVFAIMFPLFSYLFYQFSLSEFWFSNNSRKLLSNPVSWLCLNRKRYVGQFFVITITLSRKTWITGKNSQNNASFLPSIYKSFNKTGLLLTFFNV